MTYRGSLVLALTLLAACAEQPPPNASAPVAWASVANEDVPAIVTVDPDGDPRVTKLWLVVVDGSGYVRTRGTRWLANIERDPNVELRIGGAAHELRAERVSDPALAARIHDAFSEKYGWTARVNRWFLGEGATLLRLVEHPAS